MRTKPGAGWGLIALALTIAIVSACAGTTGTPASGTAGSGTAGSVRTSAPALSRQDAVAAADAACAEHNKKLLPEPKQPAEVRPFLEAAVKAYRAELADFRRIEERAGDFPELDTIIVELDAYMTLVEQHLDELAVDPKPLSDPASPYGRALAGLRTKMRGQGFTICGR